MNEQKKLWNNAHQNGDLKHDVNKPSEFAKEVLKLLSPKSKILELGCGNGNDSIGFAKAGHNLIATDFSEVVIKNNSERLGQVSGLTFEVLDMSEPFKFERNEFDAVYARLSLHYFTNEVTRRVFSEIKRVLKPNGQLFFICKSTDDPLYGKGNQIEADMFELDGHVRHFFSEEYARSLMSDGFRIEKLTSGSEKFYGYESSFVKAIASAVK